MTSSYRTTNGISARPLPPSNRSVLNPVKKKETATMQGYEPEPIGLMNVSPTCRKARACLPSQSTCTVHFSGKNRCSDKNALNSRGHSRARITPPSRNAVKTIVNRRFNTVNKYESTNPGRMRYRGRCVPHVGRGITCGKVVWLRPLGAGACITCGSRATSARRARLTSRECVRGFRVDSITMATKAPYRHRYTGRDVH